MYGQGSGFQTSSFVMRTDIYCSVPNEIHWFVQVILCILSWILENIRIMVRSTILIEYSRYEGRANGWFLCIVTTVLSEYQPCSFNIARKFLHFNLLVQISTRLPRDFELLRPSCRAMEIMPGVNKSVLQLQSSQSDKFLFNRGFAFCIRVTVIFPSYFDTCSLKIIIPYSSYFLLII